MSVTLDRLLMLKNATVNRNLGFDDVCREKYVVVAYNNERAKFEISKTTGEMVRYPVVTYLTLVNVAWEWEIQAIFFATYNIKPIWINCNFTWGSLNYTTGQWSGAVGLIQRDEADYAIFGFGGGIQYMPYHWLTRYPLELTPMWNLFGLFTKG